MVHLKNPSKPHPVAKAMKRNGWVWMSSMGTEMRTRDPICDPLPTDSQPPSSIRIEPLADTDLFFFFFSTLRNEFN